MTIHALAVVPEPLPAAVIAQRRSALVADGVPRRHWALDLYAHCLAKAVSWCGHTGEWHGPLYAEPEGLVWRRAVNGLLYSKLTGLVSVRSVVTGSRA